MSLTCVLVTGVCGLVSSAHEIKKKTSMSPPGLRRETVMSFIPKHQRITFSSLCCLTDQNCVPDLKVFAEVYALQGELCKIIRRDMWTEDHYVFCWICLWRPDINNMQRNKHSNLDLYIKKKTNIIYVTQTHLWHDVLLWAHPTWIRTWP